MPYVGCQVDGCPCVPPTAIEPPFNCDDDLCSPGTCSMADIVPTWMRPYRCQYLSAADRRARDIVIRETELG